MKQRKPLQRGDQVKFFGVGTNGYRGNGYHEVIRQDGIYLYLFQNIDVVSKVSTSPIEIDRRQVTHVKKTKRVFWIVRCDNVAHDIWQHEIPKETQHCCELIKVREVK